MKKFLLVCALLAGLAAVSIAQEEPDYANLDPAPYDPAVEPNADMFMRSWKESMPRHSHGSLIERDIFTKSDGDPINPKVKGAVLTALERFSHATLVVGASTTPTTLNGEQELFYFDSGTGALKTRNKTVELHEGVGVLVPPGVEFTMTTTGDQPLSMYLLTEKIPDGFTPQTDIVVKDESGIPFTSSNVHWSHIYKNFFTRQDGLASITGAGPVWYSPMTMGQPHSHGEGVEEIWFALKGDIHALLGKQFRTLPVGTAYKIPPNGTTPHSNINATDEPIKMFWFMKSVPDREKHKYGNLDPKPYDPATEPNIDMFIRSWKESMPRHTHGSLIERDVLTSSSGDPLHPTSRGGVLKYVNRFVYAELPARASTIPTTPKGEQEFYYVISGKGTVTGGGKTFDIFPGRVFLIPENLEFTMSNTGNESLLFYLVVEPTRAGFVPRTSIYVNDETTAQTFISDSHWVNAWEHLIKPEDGLSSMQLVLSVWLYPNTFAQPHSHDGTTEEIWVTLEGDVKFELGKQIRDLPPGTAYMIPPDNKTPHANFNITDKPIKLFYFAHFRD